MEVQYTQFCVMQQENANDDRKGNDLTLESTEKFTSNLYNFFVNQGSVSKFKKYLKYYCKKNVKDIIIVNCVYLQ